jgi:hypothetical protein
MKSEIEKTVSKTSKIKKMSLTGAVLMGLGLAA